MFSIFAQTAPEPAVSNVASKICMIERARGMLIELPPNAEATLQRNLRSCKHRSWQNTTLAAAAVTNIRFIRPARENMAWNEVLINLRANQVPTTSCLAKKTRGLNGHILFSFGRRNNLVRFLSQIYTWSRDP